jgi:hypothetical protein
MEALNGYVDLQTRRLTTFPAEGAAGLDAYVASAGQLTWQPELTGAITL